MAEDDSNLDKPLHQKIIKNVLESDGITLLPTKHGMEPLGIREKLSYARMKNQMSHVGMKIMPPGGGGRGSHGPSGRG